jgi:DNA invertase Pin-like site-specific DNA recombinase
VSTPIVAYYRVSTPRQGRSGLGLEAQRKAVAAYAASHGLTIADQFTEIETGKGSDALDRRPVFAEALRKAKKLKAAIAVAKLDRLSRGVAFIATLWRRRSSSSPLKIRPSRPSCCTSRPRWLRKNGG